MISRELNLLFSHFESDHYAADDRTPSQKRELRGIAEHYLKLIASGDEGYEARFFAQELAKVILRVGSARTRGARAHALLRAVGLSGHHPTDRDRLAYEVEMASVFEIPEDQVIEEAKTYLDTETYVPNEGKSTIAKASLKRAIRRRSKRP